MKRRPATVELKWKGRQWRWRARCIACGGAFSLLLRYCEQSSPKPCGVCYRMLCATSNLIASPILSRHDDRTNFFRIGIGYGDDCGDSGARGRDGGGGVEDGFVAAGDAVGEGCVSFTCA